MSSSQPAQERSPIPVLLTVRKLDHGGIERDVAKIVTGMDRARFTPHVAVYQGGGLRSDEVKRAGVPVLDLEVTSLLSPKILRSAAKFCGWIRKKKIRVVHAFDASAVFAAPLARLMHVPLVLSSTLGHRDLFDERTRKQLPFTDRLVDGVVVNCEAMRRHMIEDYGTEGERTILCYNGVETSEFHPEGAPKPEPVADAALVIGSLCVLRPEKRMDLLVDAFAAVHPLKPGMKLLIVGSGPELAKLQAQAAGLGIERDVVFQPAIPRVAPLLRAMDIYVSCSSSEAFSNSILEAMACGCCPVGSRVGGTPELIADGERGLLFESGNAHELARKLTLLIENDELRRKLAHNAATFAAENLNMQVALNRIGEIYETGLAKKDGRVE
ncbi:MAG TPA: glycosyltransferase family 4 protein [Bryobacteraceae bacterium]